MLERSGIKFLTELEEELKKDNNSRYPAVVSYFLAAWIERPPYPKPMSSNVCPGCIPERGRGAYRVYAAIEHPPEFRGTPGPFADPGP